MFLVHRQSSHPVPSRCHIPLSHGGISGNKEHLFAGGAGGWNSQVAISQFDGLRKLVRSLLPHSTVMHSGRKRR